MKFCRKLSESQPTGMFVCLYVLGSFLFIVVGAVKINFTTILFPFFLPATSPIHHHQGLMVSFGIRFLHQKLDQINKFLVSLFPMPTSGPTVPEKYFVFMKYLLNGIKWWFTHRKIIFARWIKNDENIRQNTALGNTHGNSERARV